MKRCFIVTALFLGLIIIVFIINNVNYNYKITQFYNELFKYKNVKLEEKESNIISPIFNIKSERLNFTLPETFSFQDMTIKYLDYRLQIVNEGKLKNFDIFDKAKRALNYDYEKFAIQIKNQISVKKNLEFNKDEEEIMELLIFKNRLLLHYINQNSPPFYMINNDTKVELLAFPQKKSYEIWIISNNYFIQSHFNAKENVVLFSEKLISGFHIEEIIESNVEKIIQINK